MKKKTVLIPVLMFGLLIFGGMLWGICKPDQAYSDTENRYLKKKPKFTWEGLFEGNYTADYETYITDQFPERDRWIGLKTRTEMALGKAETKQVWLAKDGYLIVNDPASDFESGQAKKNLQALAEAVRYYAETLGVDHVRVMLTPTASQILTDKLPKYSPRYDQSLFTEQARKNAADKLAYTAPADGTAEPVRTEAEANAAVQKIFTDTESVLSEHDDEYIYYRTDHHWTTLGAYYAYADWAQSLGLTPVADSRLKVVSENFLGTTYSRVHTADQEDTISVYDTDLPVTLNHNLMKKSEGFYDWEALKKRDQYAVFLGGNDGLLEIDRVKAAPDGTIGDETGESVLLVVKDSFANCFIPYAAGHYDRVIVADLRYLNMSLKELARQYGVTDLLVLYNVQAFATDKSVFKISR